MSEAGHGARERSAAAFLAWCIEERSGAPGTGHRAPGTGHRARERLARNELLVGPDLSGPCCSAIKPIGEIERRPDKSGPTRAQGRRVDPSPQAKNPPMSSRAWDALPQAKNPPMQCCKVAHDASFWWVQTCLDAVARPLSPLARSKGVQTSLDPQELKGAGWILRRRRKTHRCNAARSRRNRLRRFRLTPPSSRHPRSSHGRS